MFDDALLESRRQSKGRGRGIGLPLAIALHAVVLGTFVGASIWSAGDPPEPAVPVIFPVSMGPPPPRGDGGGSRTRQAATRPREPRPADVPRFIPAQEPNDSEQARLGNASYLGPEIPGPPGDPKGVDAGTGTHPSVPGEEHIEEALPIGGDVRAPELLQRVEPVYAEAARRAHLEGTVILEAIITAAGEVEEIRVVKPVNPLLDEAAVHAVRQWRYTPATLNGRAVRVFLTVSVRFGIRG